MALFTLALLIVSLSLHLRLIEYADDDAYIHMRVARNLWFFGEPYFNKGEPVMASTSPLWVALTSPAAAFREQPLLIGLLNALVLVALSMVWCGVYVRVARSSNRLESFAAALVVFFTAASSSVGLMETPCALLLVGLGFLGILRERWWGALCGVAALFVRPECVVFFLAMVALKAMRRHALRLQEVVATAVVAVPMIWFQLYHYGSLYPHTARAKEIVYDLSAQDFIRQAFISGYGQWVVKSVLPILVIFCIPVALWCVYSFRDGSRLSHREPVELPVSREFLLVFVIPSVSILCVYAAKGVFIFPWYSPLILVPLNLAVLRLIVTVSPRIKVLFSVLVAPLVIMSCQIIASLSAPSHAPFFEAGARARHLRRIGGALAREFPDVVLMAPEIGALGIEFPGKIIDAIGLASPEALAFHPLRVPEQRPTGFHGGVPAALVAKEKPALVVGLDAFMRDFMNSPVSESYEIRELPPLESDDMASYQGRKVLGSSSVLVGVRVSEGPDVSQGL